MRFDLAKSDDGLRRFLLVLFVLASAMTAIDLLLLGHFEDFWQWTPLVILVLGLLAAAWHAVDPGARGTYALRGVTALFFAGGLAGLWLHYTGNAEFEREMYPSIAGWELLREALTGATPALAPAAMIQLGLIGLACTWPRRGRREEQT